MIRRSCNPRKSAELNPYWVDFEKGGDRDVLTWGGDGGSMEYDKGIRNSVCGGKDDGGEKYGPFNMDGFTKGSKGTMGEGQKGFAPGTTSTTTTATSTGSSSLFPVGETSLGSGDDGTTTTSPPLLSSTSPDEDTGKAIDTSSFFFSDAPSSASIALQDNNNNSNDDNEGDEDTVRFDSKLFTRRRRTRKRATGLSSKI